MLAVEGVTVRFGGVTALDAIDLDVGGGEVVALLGPSGCGKTTLLRVIAGLQRPDAGRVVVGGRDLAGVPPHRRGVGLMFQHHALFPHRDVAGNVGFGLRMERRPPAGVRARVAEVLDLVGLAGFEHRSVATLSGGEAQRVALARTIAPEPAVLLLDEPLGSLDRALRDRLTADLRRLLTGLGVTTVHVTHDHTEAFAVADRVAVLRAGRVVQAGTPAEVWAAPADEGVARLLGFTNVVDAVVSGAAATTPWGVLPVAPGTPAGPARIVVRPDAVTPAVDGAPVHVRGTVGAAVFRGDRVLLSVDVPGAPPIEATAGPADMPPAGAGVALTADPAGVVRLGTGPGTGA
jgi:thiamine transport system ATP-binding protein